MQDLLMETRLREPASTGNVLVLCTHNSARSVLAEGMLKHWARKPGRRADPPGYRLPHAAAALGPLGDAELQHALLEISAN